MFDASTLLWIKALHIAMVICWFAGIFYLPRLFVYHADAEDEISIERFRLMERRLFRGIMTPSAVLAVAFGLWLLVGSFDILATQLWIWVKLALVVVLIAYHVWCGVLVAQFASSKPDLSSRFFRFFNEFPIFLMFPIVFLAVVRFV